MSDPCRDLTRDDLRRMLPDYDRKLAEAEAAGEHTCEGCGFVFYKTVMNCPRC